MSDHNNSIETNDKMETARSRFAASVVRVEDQVNDIENSVREVRSTLSGKRLWRDHFWMTAVGSLAVGALIARSKSQPTSNNERLESRVTQLDRKLDQISNSNFSKTSQESSGSQAGSLIKRKIMENPTLLASLIGIGVNLLDDKQSRELDTRTYH